MRASLSRGIGGDVTRQVLYSQRLRQSVLGGRDLVTESVPQYPTIVVSFTWCEAEFRHRGRNGREKSMESTLTLIRAVIEGLKERD